MPAADAQPFAYAVLRVVPRVERGERLNVGVVLFCRRNDFLDLRTHLDLDRLAAFAPDLDPAPVQSRLEALGSSSAAIPPAARSRRSSRPIASAGSSRRRRRSSSRPRCTPA